MGLISLSNHLALLRDCYPVKTLTTTPIDDLKPDGNALSKLCFYSAGRPKKLPKVAAAVLERAEREARTSSGIKARAGLAVTVDIARGLVSECRSELHCFAELALQVAELALGRRELGQRDPALEARGASLFHAVSVLTSGPSVGLDQGLVKQYLRCLSILSSMAQLGKDNNASRLIALSALDGAVTSELLYSAATDYGTQIRLIVPALFYNCVGLPVPELRLKFDIAEADGQTSNLGAVPTRKSAPILTPLAPPTPSDLATKAIQSLRTTVRLSQAVQLSEKLTATGEWLDKYEKGALWANEDLVQWIGSSGVAATAVQYRAGVVSWWVDQVSEIDASAAGAKSLTLVAVLSSILRGPTSLVGLGIGTVLAQLSALLVRRIPLGDSDPLRPRLLEAISGLASHVYYFDQLNDVVADLIETIRAVRSGSGPVASFSEEERNRTLQVLVSALRGVIIEAKEGSAAVETAVPMNKASSKGTVKAVPHVNGNGNVNGDGSPDPSHRPPLPESDGTVRGNGVLLGSGQGIRGKKESSDSRESAALDAMGRPVMRIEEAGRRNRISPDVFQASLFLLTDANPEARLEYQQALLLYVTDELDVAITDGGDGAGPRDTGKDSSKFFDELHATAYELATSFISAPAATSASVTLLRTPPRERTKSTSRQSRSRKSSATSVRRSSSPPPPAPVASAADYASLHQILAVLQTRRSSLAVLAAVPMLLALERDVNEHVEANFSPEGSAVRVQACRELVAAALGAIGSAWSISEIERIAQNAVSNLSPSVLPSPPIVPSSSFAAESCKLPPPFEAGAIVEPLAASHKLQAASGLDRMTLAGSLGVPWSPDSCRARSQAPVQLYTSSLANGARSFTNLSAFRVSSGTSRAPSIRTPSLADLQTSLGGRPNTAGSVHTSGTPSIASTIGTVATTETTRRRTARVNAGNVLASLGSGGSRTSGSRLTSKLTTARFVTA